MIGRWAEPEQRGRRRRGILALPLCWFGDDGNGLWKSQWFRWFRRLGGPRGEETSHLGCRGRDFVAAGRILDSYFRSWPFAVLPVQDREGSAQESGSEIYVRRRRNTVAAMPWSMLLKGILPEGLELHAHNVACRRLVPLDPWSFFPVSGGRGRVRSASWRVGERNKQYRAVRLTISAGRRSVSWPRIEARPRVQDDARTCSSAPGRRWSNRRRDEIQERRRCWRRARELRKDGSPNSRGG